jgi:protein-S-isoprenylcysteine O-methyltransferase Ste14
MAGGDRADAATTRRRVWATIGSLVFLVVVPGTVAGWVPHWLTGWRMQPPLLGVSALRPAGGILIGLGLTSLLDSFARFALVGLGTPAPIAAPTRLVVSGQYRHVRNPMYVAVLAITSGQGLLLGSTAVLWYTFFLWFLVFAFVVIYEEPTLARQFGPSYEAYRRNVRRWWPRVKPWRA